MNIKISDERLDGRISGIAIVDKYSSINRVITAYRIYLASKIESEVARNCYLLRCSIWIEIIFKTTIN